MSVLIVDDSSFIRSMISKVVTRAGLEVIGVAATGEEALELVEKLKPQYLTLDMIMPDMTGLDVLSAVKKHYPQIKVIMISTMARQSMIEEARALGADKYLMKPFDDEELEKTLKELRN